MRILLDENFPADFAALLVGHQASNVHSQGWAGIKMANCCAVQSPVIIVVVVAAASTTPAGNSGERRPCLQMDGYQAIIGHLETLDSRTRCPLSCHSVALDESTGSARRQVAPIGKDEPLIAFKRFALISLVVAWGLSVAYIFGFGVDWAFIVRTGAVSSAVFTCIILSLWAAAPYLALLPIARRDDRAEVLCTAGAGPDLRIRDVFDEPRATYGGR